MNDQFKIGDIAIHRPDSDTVPALMRTSGEEVEVIGPLTTRILSDGPYYCYDVRHASGLEFYAAPHELRRRRPPSADTNERMYVQMWRDMAGKAPQRVGETV